MKIGRNIVVAVAISSLAVACSAETEDSSTQETPSDESTGTISSALHLSTEIDQCSSVVKVLNSAGNYQTIPRGSWTTVYVNDRRFRWLCGGTTEYTTCAVGTNYVRVWHSPTSRQITWQCHA
ncbi:MAG: hypothetical protein KIS78_17805 [Labilithrix sp.]|nr:hypothetical protein [Labilithrix sp.]